MSSSKTTPDPAGERPLDPRRGMRRVLVVGGSGNFGSRIVERLRRVPRLEVIVAGRNARAIERTAVRLGLEYRLIDTSSDNLSAQIAASGADLVIGATGPLQPDGYALARSAIAAGAHYADLADCRAHVCGIRQLDTEARAAGVLVTSGVSSVPALSSAVIDHLAQAFRPLQHIEYGITASELTPGPAAIRSALAYCGKPIRTGPHFEASRIGWQNVRLKRFAEPLGWRWLACCDVADLDLLPVRYPEVQDVVFRAGVPQLPYMFGMWCLSWLVRTGLLTSAIPLAPLLERIARTFEGIGRGRSGMYVRLEGLDQQGKPLVREWQLLAEQNHGPLVPALGVVALARKIANQGIPQAGALPCMGLITLSEYLAELDGLALQLVDHEATVRSGVSLLQMS